MSKFIGINTRGIKECIINLDSIKEMNQDENIINVITRSKIYKITIVNEGCENGNNYDANEEATFNIWGDIKDFLKTKDVEFYDIPLEHTSDVEIRVFI